MLIECRARRGKRDPRIGRRDNDEGTKLELFGRHYWFRPQPDLIPDGFDPAAHICEVDDEDAIHRLIYEIPEQFNQLGKPPRIPKNKGPRMAAGQPEPVTELIDSGDELGEPDARPSRDPMSEAKKTHQNWINSMLGNPVKTVISDLERFNSDELQELMEAEQGGKNRQTLLTAFEEAIEIIKEQEQAVPDLPPDDADISLE